MIVLDTNVVSELMRADPSERVLTWISGHAGQDLVPTAVTVAEIRYGIARLAAGRRRDRLDAAAREIFDAYGAEILGFDATAAGDYADIVVARERLGTPISAFDALIAAICRSRDAALATRNIADFDGLGLELHDPWGDSG